MKANFEDLVASDTPTLVDFFATWCGPCKMMTPILQQVANEVGEQARIIKIDVDKNPQLAGNFNVRGVPTLILFKKWTTRLAGIGGSTSQRFETSDSPT
ncbi:MAG: thioredoxin [Chitinophagales bacterium]|nr:thioredoxin [Chitinophagales bacterium]